MAHQQDAGVLKGGGARCCLIGAQGQLGSLTMQIVGELFGSEHVTAWPTDGLGISSEGTLTEVQASLAVLGPALLVTPSLPVFASTGSARWRCKAGPKAVSAWHVWLRLFVPKCTVLGDGTGLFRRVQDSAGLAALLAGLFHDLRDCQRLSDRLSFARLLARSIDKTCFGPLLEACDFSVARDWDESAPVTGSFLDFELALMASRASGVPTSLHAYWKRLCVAYWAFFQRTPMESVDDLRGQVQPLVLGAFGDRFAVGGFQ